MRQPWAAKRGPIVIIMDRATPAPPRRPEASRQPEPRSRVPWRTLATVAGASMIGLWILRPTRPPKPWLDAQHAKSRRLEELEARQHEIDLSREMHREMREMRPDPIEPYQERWQDDDA